MALITQFEQHKIREVHDSIEADAPGHPVEVAQVVAYLLGAKQKDLAMRLMREEEQRPGAFQEILDG